MLREVPGVISSTTFDMSTPPSPQPTTQELHDDIFGSAPNSPATLSRDGDVGNVGDMTDLDISSSRNPDGPPTNSANTERSDIPRLRSTHVTSGYRDGISLSKASHVQSGFDEGFSLGAMMGLRTGHLLGILEGVVRGVSSPSTSKSSTFDDTTKNEMVEMYVKAKEELGLRSLFSPEWFGEDGVWRYEVEGDGDEVDFRDVVEGHPVVGRWRGVVEGVMGRFGVVVRERGREGEGEEEEG